MFKFFNNLSIAWKLLIAFATVSCFVGVLGLYNLYSVNRVNKKDNFIIHIRQVDQFINQSKFHFNNECLILKRMIDSVSLTELEKANSDHIKTANLLQEIFKQFTLEVNAISGEENNSSSLDSIKNFFGIFQKFYETQGKITIDNIYLLQSKLTELENTVNSPNYIIDSVSDNSGEIDNLLNKILVLEKDFYVNVDSKNELLNKAGEIALKLTEQEIKYRHSILNKHTAFITTFALLIILLEILFAWYAWKNISIPVFKISQNINEFSKGRIIESQPHSSEDEIGKIISASNALGEKMKSYRDFAREIGKGNFSFEMKDVNDQDELGIELKGMLGSLLKAKKEEEKRKLEEENRNWATTGYARFAEILRQNNDDMNALSFETIRNLVEYTGMNQGGLFILNDDDKTDIFLEMKACYAYDRKKFIEKRINIGEGLIGTCFLEKGSIYLTNLPDDYIKITSGLGEVNPGCILIVPIKLNDEVHGIIELASFKTIEKYEIEFVEKIGESLASTISNVKINLRTTLLLEQSQQQAEKMRSQEEEMRQNLEELHATQEEMSRKEHEMSSHLECVNRTVLELEYDFNGIVVHVNELFCRLLEYSKNELIGKHHSIIFDNKNIQNSKVYQEFWINLKNGIPWEGTMKRLTKNNREIFVHGVASPVFDANGNPVKVLEYGVDITEQKNLQLKASKEAEELLQQAEELRATQDEMLRKDHEMSSHLECLNRTVLELEYDFEGNIVHVNELFCKLLEYTKNELVGKHHSIIFDNKNIQNSKGYQDFWKNLKNGIPWEGSMKRLTKNNREIFVHGVASPVFDANGHPLKVLEYGVDITEQKILQVQTSKKAEELQQQTEELKTQEEEMRQNLEELHATQEEMMRKEQEMSSHLECLNRTVLELEYDFEGNIIHVNELFCKLLEYTKNELVGKHHSIIFDNKNIKNSKGYQDFWKNLKNGIPWEGTMKRLTKNNREIFVHGVASPVFDANGHPLKVLEYGVDITEQKIIQIQASKKAEEIQQQHEEITKNKAKSKLKNKK